MCASKHLCALVCEFLGTRCSPPCMCVCARGWRADLGHTWNTHRERRAASLVPPLRQCQSSVNHSAPPTHKSNCKNNTLTPIRKREEGWSRPTWQWLAIKHNEGSPILAAPLPPAPPLDNTKLSLDEDKHVSLEANTEAVSVSHCVGEDGIRRFQGDTLAFIRVISVSVQEFKNVFRKSLCFRFSAKVQLTLWLERVGMEQRQTLIIAYRAENEM